MCHRAVMEVIVSTTQISNEPATTLPGTRRAETKLEVIVIPVSDVDRAKAFYQGLAGAWMPISRPVTNGAESS